jgi:hypothetical protein
MSNPIVETKETTSRYSWKCPKCRRKGSATNYKTAAANLAEHLNWHDRQDAKSRKWAMNVEAAIEGVKQ